MTSSLRLFVPSAALFMIASTPVLAHAGHHHGPETAPFFQGFAHPFLGLDHLLAMIAVGTLAVLWRGKAMWLFPLLFLGGMAVGGLSAIGGLTIPYAEILVVASLIVIAGGLFLRRRLNTLGLGAMIAVTALGHGWVHGQGSIGFEGKALSFLAGALIATAVLHAMGVILPLAASRLRPGAAARNPAS